MASINVRINADLKGRESCKPKILGVPSSRLVSQALLAEERSQMPLEAALTTEGDEVLLALVRERLAAPQ